MLVYQSVSLLVMEKQRIIQETDINIKSNP